MVLVILVKTDILVGQPTHCPRLQETSQIRGHVRHDRKQQGSQFLQKTSEVLDTIEEYISRDSTLSVLLAIHVVDSIFQVHCHHIHVRQSPPLGSPAEMDGDS